MLSSHAVVCELGCSRTKDIGNLIFLSSPIAECLKLTGRVAEVSGLRCLTQGLDFLEIFLFPSYPFTETVKLLITFSKLLNLSSCSHS